MRLSRVHKKIDLLMGLGLTRSDRRARAAMLGALHDRDPWVMAAALHAVGYWGFRFGRPDWVGYKRAKALANRRYHQIPVRFAANDMTGDVEGTMAFKRNLRALAERREED